MAAPMSLEKGENWFIPQAWRISLPMGGCFNIDSMCSVTAGVRGEDGATWTEVEAAVITSINRTAWTVHMRYETSLSREE